MFDEALTWVNLVLAVFALHYLIGIGYFWLVLFTVIYVIFLRRILLLLTLGLSAFIYFPLAFYFLYVVCNWAFVPAAAICFYLPVKTIVLTVMDCVKIRKKKMI